MLIKRFFDKINPQVINFRIAQKICIEIAIPVVGGVYILPAFNIILSLQKLLQ